jgi:acyl-coenzyme A thioesterase PaaI-like protein
MPDHAARLLAWWNRLAHRPGGRWLFARILTRLTPYSGSVRPDVQELARGRAVIAMRDRRRVRNPFRSVHAVALANLGELASGLALLTALPPTLRAIVTGMDITFTRKARGRLVAAATVTIPPVDGPTDHVVTATIRNAAGEDVARVRVTWRLDHAP